MSKPFQLSWGYSPCLDPCCSTLIMHKRGEKVSRYCGLKRCPVKPSWSQREVVWDD